MGSEIICLHYPSCSLIFNMFVHLLVGVHLFVANVHCVCDECHVVVGCIVLLLKLFIMLL
jgi:hypothetical protein